MAHTSDPSTQEVEAGLSEMQSQLQLLVNLRSPCLQNQTNRKEGGGEEEEKKEGEERETIKHRDRCRDTHLQSTRTGWVVAALTTLTWALLALDSLLAVS